MKVVNTPSISTNEINNTEPSVLYGIFNNHLLYENIYNNLSLNDLQNLHNTDTHIRSSVVDYIKRKTITEDEWEWVSINSNLSEDFIREFQDKLNWYNISEYQKLSEDFIREFQYEVEWNLI